MDVKHHVYFYLAAHWWEVGVGGGWEKVLQHPKSQSFKPDGLVNFVLISVVERRLQTGDVVHLQRQQRHF